MKTVAAFFLLHGDWTLSVRILYVEIATDILRGLLLMEQWWQSNELTFPVFIGNGPWTQVINSRKTLDAEPLAEHSQCPPRRPQRFINDPLSQKIFKENLPALLHPQHGFLGRRVVFVVRQQESVLLIAKIVY
ncbi:hypothetical protein [Ralstonia pseudosolanacearum]|uniref:hypothetical protein n=1 Tax=Ralstonia pseudosolanacearum TaxID=1310165 RepID=UPI001FFBCF80|nr:hypothetical protein [Ralstonia pseudosolanacearum]